LGEYTSAFSEKVVAKLGREGLMSKIISEMKQFPETSFSSFNLHGCRQDCFWITTNSASICSDAQKNDFVLPWQFELACLFD
jgi:hypothetical protein